MLLSPILPNFKQIFRADIPKARVFGISPLPFDTVTFSGSQTAKLNKTTVQKALDEAANKNEALGDLYLRALEEKSGLMPHLVKIAKYCLEKNYTKDGILDADRVVGMVKTGEKAKSLEHKDLLSRGFNLSLLDTMDDFTKEKFMQIFPAVSDFSKYTISKIRTMVLKEYVQNDTTVLLNNSEQILTKEAKAEIIKKVGDSSKIVEIFARLEAAMKKTATTKNEEGIKPLKGDGCFDSEIKLLGKFGNIRVFGKKGFFTHFGDHKTLKLSNC